MTLADRLLTLAVAALWVAGAYTMYEVVHHPHGMVYLELTILRFT